MATPKNAYNRAFAQTALILGVMLNLGLIWMARQVPRVYWELPDHKPLGWALFLSEIIVPIMAGLNVALLVNASWRNRILIVAPIAVLVACVYVPVSEAMAGQFGLYHRQTLAQFEYFDRTILLLEDADENSPMCTYRVCTCADRKPCQCGKAQMVICQMPVGYRLDVSHGELQVTMPSNGFEESILTLEIVGP